MRAAFLIAAKDLKERLRDRSAVLAGLVVPLGLAFVFDLTLGGLSTGGTTFTYAVVDADRSRISAIFVTEVLPAVEESGAIRLREVPTEQEGRSLAADGKVAATIVVPSTSSGCRARRAAPGKAAVTRPARWSTWATSRMRSRNASRPPMTRTPPRWPPSRCRWP